MNKLFFITIIFVFNVIIQAQDSTLNLLQNGNFEKSKNGILPDYWNGDTGVYSFNTEAASGHHSLKYSNPDSSVYKICSQLLNIKAGLTYSAGVSIKTLNISGKDYGASFCVEWLDKNGKWYGGSYPKGIKGTNKWTEINSIITVPEDANKVLFCCYVRKGMTGTAWFDNAFIKPYRANRMDVMLLEPDYRGMVLEDKDSAVIFSVNLENFSLNLRGAYILATINDSIRNTFTHNLTKIDPNKLNYKIHLNIENIPNGNYSLDVSLKSGNGKLIDSYQTNIKKMPGTEVSEVYFDDHKRLIENGSAVFPLGMYWDSINEKDLTVYSQSKFNFILPYSPPNDEQMRLADKYHLKVVYSVKDFYFGTQFAPKEIKSIADEYTLLKNTVQQFRNDPALLAWYTNDEYTPDFLQRLNEHYNVLATEDPNHPVLSIIVYPEQADLYLNSTDIIGSDPYVVPNSQLFKVGNAVKTITKEVQNSRPVWMVIQAHNIGNYREFIPNPKDYRTPTYDEMRSMSWQAICNGADGLIYYSYFDIKRNPDVPFDKQWKNLESIVKEIDDFSPILLSAKQNDSILVEGVNGDNSWFNWTTREYKNQLYIFVVNNGKSEGNIKIKIPGIFKKITILNYPSTPLNISDSQVTDELKNLDLKIYLAE